MMKLFAIAAVLSFFFFGSEVVSADCSERCDHYHDYGPYDFSYIQPGLLGWPVCDRQGNCSPYLIYTHPGYRRGQITVRPTHWNSLPQSRNVH